MTKTIWTGVAILGFAAALGAQSTTSTTTSSPTQPPAQTTTAQSSNDKQVTVTGCLKQASSMPDATASAGAPATTGTTGTTGAAGSATSDQRFILTNATVSSGSGSPSATGTTGTTGSTTGAAGSAADTTSSAASGKTYRLIANPAALAEHVGKKLELTGTIEDQPSATGTTGSTSEADANAPALRVTAGKIVGNSCQQ